MSTTRTPAYRMELTLEKGTVTPFGWDVKGRYGKGPANEANLRKYVEALEAATYPGGANEMGDFKVVRATLVNQRTDKVVAELNFASSEA